MPALTFHVDGDPKPQPRTQARNFIRRGPQGKPIVTARTWTPTSADDWKAMITLAARGHVPRAQIAGPVTLELRVYLRRPQSLCRLKDPEGVMPHAGRGDVDNFAKCVMDVFTQLGFWLDDKLVYRLEVVKLWAPKAGRPGMDVRLTWDQTADDEAPGELFPRPLPAAEAEPVF